MFWVRALLLILFPAMAFAQSPGNFLFGSQLGSQQLSGAFAGKVDVNNGTLSGPTISNPVISNPTINGTIGGNATFIGSASAMTVTSTQGTKSLANWMTPVGLSAAVGTGTLSLIGATAWTGTTFPGTNNLGIYEALSYSGAPTTGFHDASGFTIPFNFIDVIGDQIAWTPVAGGTSALEIRHSYGGGNASGGRNTVLIDSVLNGPVAAGSNNNFVALQAFSESNSNVTGAASGAGNGLGSYFTVGLGCLIGGNTNVFAHELACLEADFEPAAGSSYDYGYGFKIIDFGPIGLHANVFEDMLQMSTTNNATSGTFNMGMYFGDPQAPGGGFPISAAGTMVGSAVGTANNGIDFSNVTFNNAIMLGPNGFEIEPNGHVDTNAIYSSANSLTIQDAQGNPAMAINRGASGSVNYLLTSSNTTGNAPQYHSTGSDATVGMAFKTDKGSGSFQWLNTSSAVQFQVNGVASAISYPQITPAASGNPLISVGGTAANLLLGSSGALATTATTGFPVAPTSAGAPTGAATPGSIVVDTTNSHICALISGTTWHCI